MGGLVGTKGWDLLSIPSKEFWSNPLDGSTDLLQYTLN